MRRRLLVTSAAVLAGLAIAPAVAQGAVGRFVAGELIDGPSADVQRVGDVDLARDGGGALVYVKREAGVDHVFVTRLVAGAWQPPERLDAALPTPSAQPVVSAADGGRLAVAYISGGALYTQVRPAADQPFTAPQLVAPAASNPSVDLSTNGVAYVSFTVPGAGGHDVAVARKDRAGTGFAVVSAALDVDPALDAGHGAGRSRVAVAADGVALVVWGEGGRVVARRVFENRPSLAPQDATVEGGGAASSPDVDVQDDSSFAWVVFRQVFGDGRAHAVARKLVGSLFDPPVAVDGQAVPSPGDAGLPRIDINGRGEGYAATDVAGTAFGAVLKDRKFNPAVPLGPTFPTAALPVAAVDESGDGLVAWQAPDLTIHARAYDNRRESRTVQLPAGDAALSHPGAGPSDAANGLEAAADRAGDAVVAFVQGTAGSRSIVVASFDRVPGAFRLNSGSRWRNATRAPLRWSRSFELWGPVTYSLEVNGQVIGRTNEPRLALPRALPDGLHRWRVIAIDRRGLATSTRRRLLRHDATPPRATIRVSGARRRGRAVRVRVTATDANPTGRRASGVGAVRIAFGDGTRARGRAATHRYRRRGRFMVRATVGDRAHNVVVVRRRITIR
ncbi:MAG TPA: hypothetical protein VHF51_16970 [Solirubrobacteraceae bacterium]|nr:hypothetical protein [Solirubrobacteraceae bacterium]